MSEPKIDAPLDFQTIMFALQNYWARQGCLIWQPYYIASGRWHHEPGYLSARSGPEPWKVAYVEPSVRPDDGRYGINPNRLQMHYQFQVILKPDPGNPQELYLDSLRAIGIDPHQHDIRFVEDNWNPRAERLGSWLGSVAGRTGNHPVHLLSAVRRGGAGRARGGNYLRTGTHCYGAAARAALKDIRWNAERTCGDVNQVAGTRTFHLLF